MNTHDSSVPYDPDSAIGHRVAGDLTAVLCDITNEIADREALDAVRPAPKRREHVIAEAA